MVRGRGCRPAYRRIEHDLLAELEQDAPVRDADGGLPVWDFRMVEQTAIALATVQRITHYLDEQGDVDRHGELRPAVNYLTKANEQAARMLDRLGCRRRVGRGLVLLLCGRTLGRRRLRRMGACQVGA